MIETGWCAFAGPRGGLCREPITRAGILDPERWTHTLRLFNFAAGRAAEPHTPVPMTDPAEIAAARSKWRGR